MRSERSYFLLDLLVRYADEAGEVSRSLLREKYAEHLGGERPDLRNADRPDERGHVRGDMQSIRSADRSRTWAGNRAHQRPGHLLSGDLGLLERHGVVERREDVVRIRDWIALNREMQDRSSSGEPSPPPSPPDSCR